MEQLRNVRFRSSFSSIAMVGGETSLVDFSIRGCRNERPTDAHPGASLEVRIVAIEHEPPIEMQRVLVR